MTTTDLPRISVIVPVYDDAEPLALCLDALEKQSYPRDAFEVIVVDNGSDPPIRLSPETSLHARVEQEPRPGLGLARARGIAAAKGSILAFTDADCIPEPDWLAAGEAHLLAVPECGVVGGCIEMFATDMTRRTVAEMLGLAMHLKQERFLELGGWIVLANAFVRRTVVDEVGPMNPVFGHGDEVEWCQRIRAAGHGISLAPSARVRHPARASIRQLCQRVVRIEHGWTQLRAVTGEGRGLRHWLGQYVRQPLKAIRRDVLRNPGLDHMQRVQVAALAGGLAALRIGVYALYRCGTRIDIRRYWG